MTGELRAALDLYVQALEADDGISIEGARATSKAWHRCSLLGATREDMTAAHERVGR